MSNKAQENIFFLSKGFLNQLKHLEEPDMLRVFSDEKNFNEEQEAIEINNRWICVIPSEVITAIHT